MGKYNITAHSELMQNYHPGDILGPEGRFIALQTDTGTSLLFSIGTDNIFYITKEVPGDRNGWTRAVLSGELVRNSQKPEIDKYTCKTFAAAQSAHGAPKAVIQLALVVNDGTDDLLHLSLGNSDSDTSWADPPNSPKWTPCPFNAKLDSSHHVPSPFLIAGVFISEASDKEYIVVDVVRDPHSQKPSIDRYFIDASNPGNPQWQLHDLYFDLDKDGYSSCLGRRTPSGNYEKRNPVDGLYTIGVVNGAPQFFYAPLHSAFGKPEPSKLQLTSSGDVGPDAIAACRKADDNTSDLYATGGGCLYYFPSDRQVMINGEAATGTLLIKNEVFSRVKSLFASITDGTVTVWGLNASDEVFYTTCPAGQEGAGKWSTPLPIMNRVEHLSPYINRQNGANTFFMHAGGQLQIARKLPRTARTSEGAGTWKVQELNVAPREKMQRPPAQSFRSYTTRIRVTGSGNRPAAGVPVSIEAPSGVAGFYINHRYYSAGPTPIKVDTDATGCVTAVEAVSRLDGTRLKASVEGDGAGASINPSEQSPTVQNKLGKLADKNIDLKTVTFRDRKGQQIRLIRPDANSDDVAAAHTNFCNLWEARQQKVKGKAAHAAFLANYSTVPTKDNRSEAYKKFVGNSAVVPVDGGDLLSMLDGRRRNVVRANAGAAGLASGESFWEMLVDFFVELGKIVWQVIVKIAGLVYEIFIDTIELIWNAISLVFAPILQLVAELLLEFAMWLVDLDKLKPIQAEMKKWTQKVLEEGVNAIPSLQEAFDKRIDDAIAALKNWASASPDLGDPGKQRLDSMSGNDAENYAEDPTAMLLTYAVSEYYGDVAPSQGKSFPDRQSSPLDVLWSALKEEGATLGTAFGDLKNLAQNASTMSLEAVFKEVVRILGEAVLKSAKTVVDAIMKILYTLAKTALDWLLTDIRIPVVSDVLAEWGITDFDVLDLICYAAALPVSLAYDEPAAVNNPVAAGADVMARVGVQDDAFLSDVKKAGLFHNLHVGAGILGFLATGFFAVAEETSSGASTVMEGVAWFFNLGSEVFQLASIASISEVQIQNGGFRNFLWAILGVQMATLLVFNPFWFLLGEKEIQLPETREAIDAVTTRVTSKSWTFDVGVLVLFVGSLIDAILVIPELVCTIEHIVELAGQKKSDERDLGIVDEVSNLMSFISRAVRWIPFLDFEPVTKTIFVITQAGAGIVYSFMQIGEGVAGWAAYKSRQKHAVLGAAI
jgi:hypothetical protein